uniref:Probable RNA-binding protein EIF1AD n=1 Tax=Clastoptera arizonana TaxID=38151 RepID=A0A1B6DJW6_9HEMI
MTHSTKRKHVYNELLQSELRVPSRDQQIVRVITGRGNNLHEVETPKGDKFLVSMPPKFRRNVWIKRGDFVLVEPIAEGDKVKGEIVMVLTKDHIRFYKNNNCWPELFNVGLNSNISTGNEPPGYESSTSSSSSED